MSDFTAFREGPGMKPQKARGTSLRATLGALDLPNVHGTKVLVYEGDDDQPLMTGRCEVAGWVWTVSHG